MKGYSHDIEWLLKKAEYKSLGYINGWRINWIEVNGSKEHGGYLNQPEATECLAQGHKTDTVSLKNRGTHTITSCDIGSGLCVVALSRNLKLTTTLDRAITQNVGGMVSWGLDTNNLPN